jgi:hypothetical protein
MMFIPSFGFFEMVVKEIEEGIIYLKWSVFKKRCFYSKAPLFKLIRSFEFFDDFMMRSISSIDFLVGIFCFRR